VAVGSQRVAADLIHVVSASLLERIAGSSRSSVSASTTGSCPNWLMRYIIASKDARAVPGKGNARADGIVNTPTADETSDTDAAAHPPGRHSPLNLVAGLISVSPSGQADTRSHRSKASGCDVIDARR
jgi:hypothetical protein